MSFTKYLCLGINPIYLAFPIFPLLFLCCTILRVGLSLRHDDEIPLHVQRFRGNARTTRQHRPNLAFCTLYAEIIDTLHEIPTTQEIVGSRSSVVPEMHQLWQKFGCRRLRHITGP